jgi:hypothetical protein
VHGGVRDFAGDALLHDDARIRRRNCSFQVSRPRVFDDHHDRRRIW